MIDGNKLPRMLRDVSATEIRIERKGDVTRMTFSASSEAPVERWFGTEILSHAPDAVRMERITAGAVPLLFNHDWNDPIGMLDAGHIDGGRLMVDAHLFGTARAAEVATMIDGGLRNVSIGYEIATLAEDAKRQTYTATEWTPLEVSIVTVPADPSVGIGRGSDANTRTVRIVRAPDPAAIAALQGGHTMADTQAAAGTPTPEPRIEIVADHSNRPTPLQMETERKTAIWNICRGYKIDERAAQIWIEDGTSLAAVAEAALKIMEERGRNNPQVPTRLDMPPSDVRNYSVMRALRASMNKSWDKAGLELECNREISRRMNRLPRSETSFFVPLDKLMEGRERSRRDMTAAGSSGSNYLIATDNMPGSFIEMLRNESVALTLGVQRLSGLVGNVTIPKMTAGNTAYWLSDETTQITESQPTLGQMALTPKNVAALTELSHQLMQQSTPDAEQLVLGSLARDIGLAVDIGILRGSGNTGQPTGIVTTGSIGAFTGTSLAAAGLLNAQADVATGNALKPGCAYVTTPTVASLLCDRPELTSTGTTRIWKGNLARGTIFDWPAMSSAQMTAGTMLFGWWPSVVLAEWGVLELMTNPFSDFTRGLTAVRGWYTCDVGVRYAAAWSYASSIT
jgi:HK97 family phage major capsid protein/HK97 family phage prohead protease